MATVIGLTADRINALLADKAASSHGTHVPAGGTEGQVVKIVSGVPAWAADATGGGGVSDGDKGDITISGTGTVYTIDNSVVTLAKMANMATASFLGRITAATGIVEVLSATQATSLLNVFTSALKGLVPASGGGTTTFLRADGTWVVPPSTGITVVQDENTTVGTGVTQLDFQGAGVTASAGTGEVIITIPGGGSGITIQEDNIQEGTSITTLDFQGAGVDVVVTGAEAVVTVAGGSGLTDGDKGDITVSGSGATWTIDGSVVTLAKMANVATASILGRVTAATGVVEALTGTQATTLLNVFTSALKGLVPASGGGTTTYLRADGTWVAPPDTSGVTIIQDDTVTVASGVTQIDFQGAGVTATAGTGEVIVTIPGGAGISDGDKGDITVSGSGATWTIDSGVVTLAKMANVATARFLGRVTAATGVVEALTGTQATTLLDVFTTALKGVVPASGGGTTNFLRADGTWAVPPGGAGVTDGDKGDITVSGSGATWTIDAGAVSQTKLSTNSVAASNIVDGNVTTAKIADANVTNAKLASMTVGTIKGSLAGGAPVDLTGTQVMTTLPVFTSSAAGVVAPSGGGTTNFLRADGSFAVPAGGGTAGTTWHVFGTTAFQAENPSSALGADGDFAIHRSNGWIYGPKGRSTPGQWVNSPVGIMAGPDHNYTGINPALIAWTWSRGSGYASTATLTGTAGTQHIGLCSANTGGWFNATNGQVEVTGRFTHSVGSNYSNYLPAKGGHLAFRIIRLPGAGRTLSFGLGAYYGNIIPGITLSSSGILTWNNSPITAIAGTLQANDDIFLHSAWGKYDLIVNRGTTLIASSIGYYGSQFATEGTMGWIAGGTTSGYGDAGNPVIGPNASAGELTMSAIL